MLSQTASFVLLDASPLCRFAQCDQLDELRAYLGARARIAREVERELMRLFALPEFASLADHLVSDETTSGHGAWPKRTKPLPDALKADFANLLALKRVIGQHEWSHAGEIATVLMAEHRSADLVVVDDDWGAKLAKSRCLRVISTARLSLEMVVAGALSEEEGLRVFDAATPTGVGRDQFGSGLSRLRRHE